LDRRGFQRRSTVEVMAEELGHTREDDGDHDQQPEAARSSSDATVRTRRSMPTFRAVVSVLVRFM